MQVSTGEDDLLTMIPVESDLVLSVDMAKLRSSPWTRASLAKVMPDDLRAFDSGFDFRQDLDRVVFAKIPALQDEASVFVAQGRFDRARMVSVFAKKPGAVQKSLYRNAELFVRGEDALAFLGARVVLSGPPIAVRAAVDCGFGVARSIDSESWVEHLRRALLGIRGAASPAAALYVRLQPATRAELVREVGEFETLEELAARLDLERDLDLTVLGTLRTPEQARDTAARMADRIRESRGRPIVAAFGLAKVLGSVHFSTNGNSTYGSMHISQEQQAEISERMAVVAETMKSLRAKKDSGAGKEAP
jgi:hypothetical protein